ncbi:MAG: hypothetical protein HY258_12725, partial [Chloroflexi bacterium]|nr:hypothetical protein [Chloroflexota bacterium]
MLRKLLVLFLVVLLALTLPASALAQGDYYFRVEKETVQVYWNADGTLSLDYTWVFVNQPGAHVIDFVDVGMPNGNFSTFGPEPTAAPPPSSGVTPVAPIAGTTQGAYADVNGKRVSISSDYQGQGSYGFSVDMGPYAIQPGQTGTVHVYVGGISGVLYPDDQDSNYASAVFSPTWFGSKYVTGSTDAAIIFHLPPGVQANEPRWHSAPSDFPSEPQTGFDQDGRVIYTWQNSNASASKQYMFGASFPKSYVPADAIVTAPAFDVGGLISSLISNLFNILCFGFFAFMFLGLPIISAVQGQRRKLQYIPPRIGIEGHGIKRGLTAVEAGILMEQPLDKVMTMILFGVIKKGAASVTSREPLKVEVTSPMPDGLHDYETNFLNAFKESDARSRQSDLRDMMVKLVKSVGEKMKG